MKTKAGLSQSQRDEIKYQLMSSQITLGLNIAEMSKKFLNNIHFDHPTNGNHPADETHDIPVVEEYRATHSIEQLRQINAALERMSSDEFGICIEIECKQKIPFKRLRAMPTSLRCVSCEEKNEIKNGFHQRNSINDFRALSL